MAFFRRFAGPAIGFLVGAGLEVSGIEAFPLALAIWGVAAAWALLALATWPPVSEQLPVIAIAWPALQRDAPGGADSQPVGLDKFPPLGKIAKHDLESPTSMVKITKRRVVKWDLPARRSEVVFGVTIFNGNVYDILVSPATGNLTYKGQQVETPILPREGGVSRLPRGHEYEITLTQYVPNDLAYEVQGEIDSGCIRMFGWSGVTVSLRADYPDAPDRRMAIDDRNGFRVGD